MQIWAIGTTRNEVDLIRLNVLHHLNEGIDRFLFLDNESIDGTTDVLADLSRAYPFQWATYRGAFRQHVLLTTLAQQAFAAGADWVIPIDADEFWQASGSTVRDVLEQTTVNALRVQLTNFIQRREQRHTTPDALSYMTRTVPMPIGTIEKAEELVEQGEISYVQQLYHHKWIQRATATLEIGWGNHTLEHVVTSFRDADEIVCLHAPLRSYSVLEGKVEAGRPPDAIDEYFNKAWHLRRWQRLAWEGHLEAEWRANSYEADSLDVYGRRHSVVLDTRLADIAQKWLSLK